MRLRVAIFAFLLCVSLAACSSGQAEHRPVAAFGAVGRPQATVAPKDFGQLRWREIGPAVMGGRLDVVVGIPGDPSTIYLGHSSGGLYKSTDGGMSFRAIFNDGRSSSIGAIAVAPSNPKVLLVGTGEGFPRNSSVLGDGVYVSRDGGNTWKFAGLARSQHIAKIAIDPHDPNVALVAAMGPEFSSGGERGIYRTIDGGKSWQRVVYVNETTGGSDVLFDPSNPSVAFAGTFDYLRQPWHFRGGGPGSGLYKSIDNGATWTKLTDPALHNGLPGGPINRVGVSLSAHHPNVVYALVPTKKGMLYRSDDDGVHWKIASTREDINYRPFYGSQVRVDPDDPNDVWIASRSMWHSINGGKKFTGVNESGDSHDVWIDPTNRRRVLIGDDYGLHATLNGGVTWSYINNVSFLQVYRVGYDHALPYHVMGGMQDNSTWWGPNTVWNDYGLGPPWRLIGEDTDGPSAYPDARDENVIYMGSETGLLMSRDLRTGEGRYISPQPLIISGMAARQHPYRFNWSAPLLVSAADPGAIYYAANVVFRSRDQGESWVAISPDLTQPCDARWLQSSGGPIEQNLTNAETYCTITALAERDAKTLWAGTDDGNLYVTSDGGATWRNIASKIQGLPAQSWVASLEVSHRDGDTAYATFDRHRFNDTKAYVYITHDGGATWTNISTNLPSWAYVVREDPREPHLLFAGTEDGIWVSFDGGTHWQSLLLRMNHVPVFDLQIQPDANDLIAGTHGRGFAILDDIGPLEGLARAVQTRVALFAPADAWRYAPGEEERDVETAFVPQNRPYGAIVSYYLEAAPKTKQKLDLTILDSTGRVIRHIKASAKDGINRVVWDLTIDPPGGLNAKQDARPVYDFYTTQIEGPEVLPGTYTVQLKARGATLRVPVVVRLDPAVKATDQDLHAQYDALERLAQLQEQGERWLAAIADRKKHSRKDDAKEIAQLDAFADRLRNNGDADAKMLRSSQVIDQLAFQNVAIREAFRGPTQAQAQFIDRYAAEMKRLEPEAKNLLPPTPAPHSNKRG